MKKSALIDGIAMDQGGQTWAGTAPADLTAWISGYLGRQSRTHCERFTIFPNARIELLFNFGSPYLTNIKCGAAMIPLGGASLFAPKLERNEHQCGPLVDWFLVQLSLSGCLDLLGTAGSDLLQHDRLLSEFVGDQAQELHQALSLQPTFSARSEFFSRWARARLRARSPISRISSFCELSRGQIISSVRDAANQCGIGERRLRDCFVAEVGIPPKQWLSIVRAERLWTTLHPHFSSSHSRFAEFSDESHAHREFKRWTGMTIGAFQVIKRRGDGLVNGGLRRIQHANELT